jgi:hypothetical protein
VTRPRRPTIDCENDDARDFVRQLADRVLIAVTVPLLHGFAPRLCVPSVVIEIIVGVVVGPSVQGWFQIGLPVKILAIFGWPFCCSSRSQS